MTACRDSTQKVLQDWGCALLLFRPHTSGREHVCPREEEQGRCWSLRPWSYGCGPVVSILLAILEQPWHFQGFLVAGDG